ncbi:MAG: M13 family peptidase [Clostridiales bacterium]|nr:M13 family peptidase [Clostridiales bacterium]
MKKEIRVQDDLYLHVNKEWIDNAVIPDDKPRIGGFADLDQDVEKLLIGDFNKMAAGKMKCPDENVKKAVELYKLVKNTEKRNAEGVAPVMERLHKIESLGSISDFNTALSEFVSHRINLPFSLEVTVDFKDSLHHALMLFGPSAILPDVTYYKPEMEQQKNALLGVWQGMAAQLLTFTDLTAEQQTQYVKDALEFDAIIATLVKSNEEWSDYPAMYNPMSVEEVAKLLAPVDFVKLAKDLFGKLPEKVIVAEPRFLNGFAKLFNADNFEKYKHWAYVTEYIGSTSLLSEQIRAIGATYSNMLSGVAALPSIEKQAYRLASSVFSEPVGIYYGKKYFGEKAKADVVEIVKEIIETYKGRVAKNDFLSEQTKEKAIKKLGTIVIKMGYPDKCKEIYNKLAFGSSDSLYKAMEVLGHIRTVDNNSKLYKDVDRTEWPMPGHMVNACYSPTSNDITFPAAILQAPFYSIKQSRSENLGGIGAVIGHEISHAFDNNGAKCDENGNLNNWWTDEDFKRFEERTHAMIEEFDGIELPQGKVNGKFIVSENIADNGGMAVTLEMMSHLKNADYQAYFRNWARVWCMKARPEYLQLLLSVDVHGPAELRANMQPRNFPEWYKAFDVTEKDGMYLAPEKRVTIW